MSYCVNCGVELGKGAEKCPLCGTPVCHPGKPVPEGEKPFFSDQKEHIEPVSKKELALLLTAMFASVAICCGLLNLIMRPDLNWWFYAAGASGMLWIWFVLPLLWRKMPGLTRVFLNLCAVSLYILVIAAACGGLDWYLHLALPLLFSATAVVLLLWFMLVIHRHSMLSSAAIALAGVGLECMAIEFCVDRFLFGFWRPGWSLIVLAVCVGLCVPLMVVRRVPSMREEVRRRFHL